MKIKLNNSQIARINQQLSSIPWYKYNNWVEEKFNGLSNDEKEAAVTNYLKVLSYSDVENVLVQKILISPDSHDFKATLIEMKARLIVAFTTVHRILNPKIMILSYQQQIEDYFINEHPAKGLILIGGL